MKALKTVNRNIVYLVVALLVLVVVYVTEPAAPILPHGVFLPSSNQTYPAKSANQVNVFDAPPAGAKIIGNVRVELHFSHQSKRSEAAVIEYARGLAAKAGANALIVKTFFGTPQAGLEQRYIFLGKAAIITKNS